MIEFPTREDNILDLLLTDTPSQIPPSWPRLHDMPAIRVTHKGVLDLLEAIVPGKASGPDNIPARVLQESAKSLAPVLTDFFQQSLDESRIPDDWKQQHVQCTQSLRRDRTLTQRITVQWP